MESEETVALASLSIYSKYLIKLIDIRRRRWDSERGSSGNNFKRLGNAGKKSIVSISEFPPVLRDEFLYKMAGRLGADKEWFTLEPYLFASRYDFSH